MKKKEWKYQIIRGEDKVEKIADDVFYTSDTEAFLVFKLEDPRLAPRQALLNLHNRNDGSVVSETVLVEDGVIEWEMREEVIVHAGNWQVQVIYEQLKDGEPEKYTAPIINFPVKNDLLNQKTTRLIAVENWHRLITNAGDLVENLEELETTYQELLDTGVLQTNINNKLEDLETEYAPRLTNLEQNDVNLNTKIEQTKTEVTTQLAQKTDKGNVSVRDINKNLGKFDQSYMTDEFIAQFVENTQPINPVPAKRSVTSEYLADRAVTRSKTSFSKNISTNLFDKDEANFSGIYSSVDGSFNTVAGYGSSAFIPVYPGKTYVISAAGHVAYWDNVGEFISGVSGETILTPPPNATAMTVAFFINNVDKIIIAEGSILPIYEKPKYTDDNLVLQQSQIVGDIPRDKLDIIEVYSENLFDKTKVNKEGFYNSTTGLFVRTSGYWASDFIEVEEGKTYIHRRTGHVTFWDENKEFVSGLSGDESNPLTVPNGVKYVVFTVLNTDIDIEMLVEGTVFPTTYIPYQIQYKLSDSIEVKSDASDLSGLTWNVLGDSITSALGVNTPYHKLIAQKHGMTVNNYGISGSRIAVWPGSDQPMSVRYVSMSDNADIITVFGGTNDYGNNVTMGDIDSTDTETFYGSLNVLCIGLIKKYPGKRIGFITPMHRRNPDYAKMKLYIDAIKEVCGKYSIPVLDMWNGGGLYTSDDTINSIFFSNADGLHPNNEGHKVIARRIESFVKSL